MVLIGLKNVQSCQHHTGQQLQLTLSTGAGDRTMLRFGQIGESVGTQNQSLGRRQRLAASRRPKGKRSTAPGTA
jgi:hypothetical protein